jgi:iron complex outermembrane receptor protein
MMLKSKVLPIPVAVSVLLLYGIQVQAEEEIALRNVVVSASKVEQTTSEAPSSVSVISAKDIEDSNVVRLGDALTAKVPSLYLKSGAVGTTSRGSGTGIIALRGAYGARTKVLLDGITNMADANSANLNMSSLSLNEVDRVEIVPGVSSSLYGSDAIGGVVNIITKAPTKREFSAKLARGFGDGDRTTVGGGYRDRWENGLGVSVNFHREEMGGYNKNDLITVSTKACGACTTTVSGWEKTTDTSGATNYIIGDRGAVSNVTRNVGGTLYFDISPTSKIKAGVTKYESANSYSHYNIYLNAPVGSTNLKIDGGRLASLAEASTWMPGASKTTETRYTAGYEGKVAGEYLLKLDASYVDREYYYLSPNTTAATTFYGGPGTATHTPNVTKDVSAQLSFPVGTDHFLVSGLAFNRTSLNRAVYAVSDWRNDGSKGSLNDQGDGYAQTNSIYIQDQIAVGPALTLYAGARYDDWQTHGFVAKWVGGVNPPQSISKHGDSSLSPRLAAVYKLTEAVALKASIGTAFRAPTLYDMYAADTVSGVKLITASSRLKPEKAKAFDLGTELNFPSGANFKAAYFRTRISDMIYSKETAYTGPYTATIPVTVTTLSEKTNAAGAVTKGVELSGDVPLATWLKGSASYTWTDARITNDDTGTGLLGKRLVYVPKNMASLGLQAQYNNWSANLATRYSGLSYTSATNADVVKDVYSGTSKYWLSDLKVGYQFDKNFKLAVMVNNLFDKKYYEYYLMPGRNVAVELSAKF